MSFNWRDYLDLAYDLEDLAADDQSGTKVESRRRSCVSRAYYAAFHQARNFLSSEVSGLPTSIRNIRHEDVIFQYANAPDRERQEIGSHLRTLKSLREDADYENDYPPNRKVEDDIYIATETASEIVKIIQGLTYTPRPAVVRPNSKRRCPNCGFEGYTYRFPVTSR